MLPSLGLLRSRPPCRLRPFESITSRLLIEQLLFRSALGGSDVEHLYKEREPHRKVNIALVDGMPKSINNKDKSDHEKKGQSEQLIGFGTFKVVSRKARTGVNPKTGEKIKIKASKAVKFGAGKELKSKLK